MTTTDEKTNKGGLGGSFRSAASSLLVKLYDYHGEYKAPKEVISDVWAAPLPLPQGTPATPEYFLHYFQSQGFGPTNNECVTTSTVMAMNMIEDRIAWRQRGEPLRYEANLCIEDFIRDLDGRGMLGWRYRFPTRSWFPGMMPPWGARNTLRKHAVSLKHKYGKSYRVKTKIHQTVDDLIQALEQNKVILIHGAWQKKLSDPKDQLLAWLGGMPHTMVLVGYESSSGLWNLLNPADPWVKSRNDSYQARMYRMNTQQLMDFWGRRFVFYPPRFAITTLTMEE